MVRTCGNPDCKNYGKSWDTKHHSMCPYCNGGNGSPPTDKSVGILPNELSPIPEQQRRKEKRKFEQRQIKIAEGRKIKDKGNKKLSDVI